MTKMSISTKFKTAQTPDSAKFGKPRKLFFGGIV